MKKTGNISGSSKFTWGIQNSISLSGWRTGDAGSTIPCFRAFTDSLVVAFSSTSVWADALRTFLEEIFRSDSLFPGLEYHAGCHKTIIAGLRFIQVQDDFFLFEPEHSILDLSIHNSCVSL